MHVQANSQIIGVGDTSSPQTYGNSPSLTAFANSGEIILHRINHLWHTHYTISPLKHCQRGNTVTDSALLLRAVNDGGFNLYTFSWDFCKAFDFVSKPIIKLARFRFRVPDEVVEWIVSLDQDSHLIHLTPIIKDILLRSLEILLPIINPLIPGPPGTLVFSQNSCYADDLLSATATIEHLQTKADLVSAFALIFGLDIVINTLHLHGQIWEPSTINPNLLAPLTLRGPQWTSILIPIKLSTKHKPLLQELPAYITKNYQPNSHTKGLHPD
eukprot:gene12769-biopygen6271